MPEQLTAGGRGAALEAVKLFAEAMAEAEAGFQPTLAHLERARRISAALSAIRQKGEIVALASAINYALLLRFLFLVYTAFQNKPTAENGQAPGEPSK